MTDAFTTIYNALVADDPELLAILKDNWGCLHQSEKDLIDILRKGSVVSSLGGFDADDSGKLAEYDTDGSLAATNFLKIYKGVGHTDYFAISPSNVTGEVDVGVTNKSGQLPVISADAVPSASADGGTPGEIRLNGTHLYIYVGSGVDAWRRVAIAAF